MNRRLCICIIDAHINIYRLYIILVVLMELYSDRSFCLHHVHAEITREVMREESLLYHFLNVHLNGFK